jgi:hypothetical protein
MKRATDRINQINSDARNKSMDMVKFRGEDDTPLFKLGDRMIDQNLSKAYWKISKLVEYKRI